MKKTKVKIPVNEEILSPADQELYAVEAKKWICEHYDQHVCAASEVNYRLNDEITCSRVVSNSGVLEGILTVWREAPHGIIRHHFDKRS
jgi:hypothetical protein